MEIAARQIMWSGAAGKPYEGPLWFIETGSTGTYGIDTGVTGYCDARYSLQFLPSARGRRLMGHSPYGWFYFGAREQQYELGSVTTKVKTGNRDSIQYQTEPDSSKLFINGVLAKSLAPTEDISSKNLAIFGYPGGVFPSNSCIDTRLWGCRIEQGGKLVRDFVPWMQNGIVGLMDRVEDRFYPNGGSGELTAGYLNAKAYVQDGLIMQLDGIENAGEGKHLDAPNEWKDISPSGGFNPVTLSNVTTTKDSMVFSRASQSVAKSIVNNDFADNSDVTLELMVREKNVWTSGRKDMFFNSSKLCFGLEGGGERILYPVKGSGGFTGSAFIAPHQMVGTYAVTLSRTGGTLFFDKGKAIPKFTTGAYDDAIKDVYIGTRGVLDDQFRVDADIHSVRIYNRTLTPEEITWNYMVDKERFKTPAQRYVQDGLIFQLDGIENAGYGKHSGTTKTWVDLIGNKALTPTGNPQVRENGFHFDGNSYFTVDLSDFLGSIENNTITLEVIFQAVVGGEGKSVGILGDNRGVWKIFIYPNDPSRGYFIFKGVTIASFDNHGVQAMSLSGKRFYRNGLCEIEKDIPVKTYPDCILRIGADSDGYHLPSINDIHSIRVYNRVISDEEIATNYAIDKERFNLQ